jgi:hypothetical protein
VEVGAPLREIDSCLFKPNVSIAWVSDGLLLKLNILPQHPQSLNLNQEGSSSCPDMFQSNDYSADARGGPP